MRKVRLTLHYLRFECAFRGEKRKHWLGIKNVISRSEKPMVLG